jgi:phytoene dehydrogenase-like protein
MAREAESRGVRIDIGSPVAQVRIDASGKACGGVLEDGTEIGARAVVANVNPRLLFGKLLADAGEQWRDRVAPFENYACESATLRMNVALSELPDFTCQPGEGPHLSSGIIMAPSLAYMDRAHVEARELGWSPAPIVEVLIPSTVDASLAPPGRHVASLFCQHFRYRLPEGRSWDDDREQAADRVIETVTRHAPNFRTSVLGRKVLTPLDLERDFGLIGGDIFHGKLSLNQLFSARPVLGHADYRMPFPGLYLCGSGAHPGGGVTGVPGHNAAREVARDLGRRRKAT